MIVCHCTAVSHRAVERTVSSGGACDLDGVTERCGAGGHCGGCRPALERLLAELLGPPVPASITLDA